VRTCRSCSRASATLKRFDPTTRYGQEIAEQLTIRQGNIKHSIHNFRLLVEALGGKDEQLAQLVDASNAVFATFSKEDQDFQRTLHLLPGALHKTGTNLAKLATASHAVGTTLHKLEPFAKALAPSQEATRRLALKTTPIIKSEIRPFARQILPVIAELKPDTQEVSEAFPNLAVSFKVLDEFFNELAYNPGPSKGGFLFFLDWGNHNLNSVVSSSDANGALGRSLIYFNCNILPLFKGVSEINPTVNLLVGLLKVPTKAECQSNGILKPTAAVERAHTKAPAKGPFSGLGSTVFGHSSVALAHSVRAHSARTSAGGGGR
jgi:phospholipid/cholesterol/gamma-HCH transport system substrate-binding protein